ncbi:hypothetical protein Bca52824_096523 [Brassica carinata]|uniref:F-box domain-containing protein n=1 Tax=Brassica carinata TaxID=52824 RepID=A0A8X7NXZ9_BRACI|nr:hypothetical protein Bca52824_096523 [Brassica carinata]
MEERAVKLARIDKNTVLRRINELPDELIMKIFSTVLPFKASVATRLLSKWCEDPGNLMMTGRRRHDRRRRREEFNEFLWIFVF